MMAKQLKAEISVLEELLSQLEHATSDSPERGHPGRGLSGRITGTPPSNTSEGAFMLETGKSKSGVVGRVTHAFNFSLTFDEDWTQGAVAGGELCESLAPKLGVEASQVKVLGSRYHTGLTGVDSGIRSKGAQLGSLVVMFQVCHPPP